MVSLVSLFLSQDDKWGNKASFPIFVILQLPSLIVCKTFKCRSYLVGLNFVKSKGKFHGSISSENTYTMHVFAEALGFTALSDGKRKV